MKPKLVRIGFGDLSASYLEQILAQYFDLDVYDDNKTYDKSTVFAITRPEHLEQQHLNKHLSQGCKLIVANLWEARSYWHPYDFKDYLDNVFLIVGCKNLFDFGWKHMVNVPNWFWYNESLWYSLTPEFAKIKNYKPNRTNCKKFFMPIRLHKPFRTHIVNTYKPVLDDAIWSYCGQWGKDGQQLPIDETSPIADMAWDRQFNKSWYNDTYFTVAVETAFATQLGIDRTKPGSNFSSDSGQLPCELFVTEKTFKPIAFKHPFQVLGMPGTLEFLKNNGFETYDHIFDESYDSMPEFEDRILKVLDNITTFNVDKYNDPLTEQKMEHNYRLFYNIDRVVKGVKQELIEPLLEWIK